MPDVEPTPEDNFAGHIDMLGLQQLAEEEAEEEDSEDIGLELDINPDTMKPMLCVGTLDMGDEETPIPRSLLFVAALDGLRAERSKPIYDKIEFLVRPGSENKLLIMLRVPEEESEDDATPAEILEAIQEITNVVAQLELRYEINAEEAAQEESTKREIDERAEQAQRKARKAQKAARRKSRK
jgi:hypothetical protein